MDNAIDGDIVEQPDVPDIPEIDDLVELQDIPETPEPPTGSNDLTIHPGRGPEFEPLPETDPISVPGQEGEAELPPEEWHPGGPEGGG